MLQVYVWNYSVGVLLLRNSIQIVFIKKYV